MNLYKIMKQKHQEEVNSFPMQIAFSDKQFEEGMKKLGLEPHETDKVYSLGGGCFYRKSDSEKLHDMLDRHEKEFKSLIAQDTTGEDFIFDMFDYELSNHEYTYTWDISSTLDSLGLTADDINNSPTLLHGLKKAMKEQKDWYEKQEESDEEDN